MLPDRVVAFDGKAVQAGRQFDPNSSFGEENFTERGFRAKWRRRT
ncbi:hypothetical protein MTBSS4_190033 [Magnetospirillum sp. SS-4]|nr:hypothetical protein MTBSS4_190033 [Magnetospirillum sp. SS-4]